MKFKLAHKVLIVIAVPVFFQLGFLWFFNGFLRDLDTNQTSEQEAIEAGLLRDHAYVVVNQRMLLAAMYRATKNPGYATKFRQNDKELNSYFKKAAAEWQDDPEKAAALEQSWQLNQRFSWMLQKIMNGEKAERVSDLLGGRFGMMIMRAHLSSPDYYNHNIQQLFERSEQGLASSAQQVRGTESAMKATLLIAMAISSAIGIASGLFFSRSIANRLRTVLGNIKLMASPNTEPQPVSGSDEIAALNEAVIDTARQIHDAEEFQAQTAHIVAEELERPLESVSSAFVELQKSGFDELSEKGGQRLEQVGNEISRIRHLVKDLLVLDGIRDVGWDLQIHDVDLSEIGKLAVDVVRDLARSREVELVTDLRSTPVQADPDRVVQVVVNLLSNAIKFSPPGSRVEIESSFKNGYGRLSVTDHGRGIAPQFHAAIFGKFEQEQSADADEKGGSGLGLAISNLLIESQKGLMGFKSAVGEGSVFWLQLPAADSSSIAQSATASSDTGSLPAVAPSLLETAAAPPSAPPPVWRNTLWQKGLALICLPLVVQLITVSVLWLAMSSMSKNLVDFKTARLMADTHSTLVNEVARGTVLAMLYNVTRDADVKERTIEAHGRLNELVDQLRVASKADPLLVAKTEELQHMVNEHITLENQIMAAEQDTRLDPWFGPENGAHTERLLVQMQAPLDEVITATRSAINSRTLARSSTRRVIEVVLSASAVLTALLSAGLGLFMIGRLSRRVDHVVTNAQHLSKKEPLAEPLPGNDELAFVDHSFFEAAQRLSKLERFKRQMVSITSHELRTPLASLLATADLIDSEVFGALTTRGREILSSARQSISSLISMISTLLDAEKMQSGKTIIRKSSVPLDSTLDAAASNVKTLARDRVIDLRTNGGGLLAEADGRRLTQALTAVLTDAIENAPRGAALLLDSVASETFVELRLSAPQSALPASIESANQRARTRLALTFSKLVAEQHGGTLEIYPHEDEHVLALRLPAEAQKPSPAMVVTAPETTPVIRD